MGEIDEGECSKHPCAPHGFNRNASHSEDRYVCDCEGWSPDRTCEGLALLAEVERLKDSRDWYSRRCDALQAVQDKMRDPERKAVCDILANGSTTALEGA